MPDATKVKLPSIVPFLGNVSNRVTWCRLEPDALHAASVWMQGFGQFEPVDLDGLERLLVGGGLLPRTDAADDGEAS